MEIAFAIAFVVLAFYAGAGLYLLRVAEKRHALAEQAWRLERIGLLNRIQAPEQAVLEAFEPNEIRHVPFDDDEAYWTSVKGDS